MSRMAAILLFIALMFGDMSSARADATVQAREVARINNCQPSKIDVYQQDLGLDAETVYKVDCAMPKATDASAPAPNALLIDCDGGLCTMIQSLSAEKK